MRVSSFIMLVACLLALPSFAYALEENASLENENAQTTQAQISEQDIPQAEPEAEATESANTEEEPSGFGYEVSGTLASGYLWRGLLLTDGPVFQPSFTISQDELSLNLWGNVDLGNANGFGGELSEVDLTLDYTREIGEFAFSTGIAYYGFPHTGIAGTNEAYASVSLDRQLSPTVAVWRDFGETDGTYCTFALSHSLQCELSENA